MTVKRLKILISSATAKDTFILFGGNIASAFWGFVFTLIVARSLTIEDFGIFSAALNLATILTSLSDLGITTGSVGFIANSVAKKDNRVTNEYIKASIVIRIISITLVSLLLFIFPSYISKTLLASDNFLVAMLTGLLCIFMIPNTIFPYILQAKRQFLESVILDNAYFILRLSLAYILILVGLMNVNYAILSYGAGFVVSIILGIFYLKTQFIYSRPKSIQYKKLIRFSGWLGVNRFISSISGRLDIQMLAVMAGASATGIYSIPSRLASFIIVLAASFSSVLATRMSAFENTNEERKYIIKSTMALIPIVLVIIIWILAAKPFILILFGDKYLEAVPIFQALALSQIPFILTVPAVTAIIYAMKKTVYIGALSFFQLGGIFVLNYLLIPRYGSFGPTITFGITNTLLAVYVWFIVIKYYSKNSSHTRDKALK